VLVCGLDSVSSRVISAKKKGSKNLAGIVVFLDPETLLMLEDIASVVGSVDEAVARAIRREHAQIFGGEFSGDISASQMDLDELVRRLEEKLVGLVSNIPVHSSATSRNIEMDMPPLQAAEGSEEAEGEELALEDVLESVMVVEVDDSEVKGREDRADDEEE